MLIFFFLHNLINSSIILCGILFMVYINTFYKTQKYTYTLIHIHNNKMNFNYICEGFIFSYAIYIHRTLIIC